MSKAPDKIYIPIRFKDSGRLAPTWWQEPIEGYTNIPYIRKDALFEWLEGCKANPVITDLQKGNIQELIKHIESL